MRMAMYDESKIIKISPREHIRMRPGMYIGGVDEHALHLLIYEVVEHSVDEAMAGRCDHIWITLCAENEVSIRDNSSGFSVEIDEHTGITKLEGVMTIPGFERYLDPKVYRVSSGFRSLG